MALFIAKVVLALLALSFAAASASTCTSTVLTVGQIIFEDANTENITYYTMAVPNVTLKSVGVEIYFSPSCSYVAYLGYDGVPCPDAQTNNETLQLVPVPGPNNEIKYTLGRNVSSVLTVGLLVTNPNCTVNNSVIFNLMVQCPAACPGHSLCSNNGCGCFNSWYGMGCNITGPCDPYVTAPTACAIDNGIGYGYQQCIFADQYMNTTTYGTCIAQECLKGYYILDNHCAKITCDNTTTCNNNGYCNMTNNQCVCNPGSFGANCNMECNSKSVRVAAITGVGIATTGITYYNVQVPPTTLKFNGLEIDFSLGKQCGFTVYVGYDGLTCPNSTYNNGTLKMQGGYMYATNTSTAAVVNFGFLGSNDTTCNQAIMNVNIACPAACPGKSVCSNRGCSCFADWWGMGCDVNGVCDPTFNNTAVCGIPNGYGYSSCEYGDKSQKTSLWGPCVPAECLAGYHIKDMACTNEVPHKKDSFVKKHEWAIIFGAIGVGLAVVVGMAVLIARRKRHHHYIALDH